MDNTLFISVLAGGGVIALIAAVGFALSKSIGSQAEQRLDDITGKTKAKLDQVEEVTKGDRIVYYEFHISVGKRKREVLIDPEGKFLKEAKDEDEKKKGSAPELLMRPGRARPGRIG